MRLIGSLSILLALCLSAAACFEPRNDCAISCDPLAKVPCGGGLVCVAGKQGNVCAHLGETCGGSRDAAADMRDSGTATPDVREAAIEPIAEHPQEAGQDVPDGNQMESRVDATDAHDGPENHDADGAIDVPPDMVTPPRPTGRPQHHRW